MLRPGHLEAREIDGAGGGRMAQAVARAGPTAAATSVVRVNLGANEEMFVSLAVQCDAKIVAAGYVEPHEFGDTTIPRMVIPRFPRNGSLGTHVEREREDHDTTPRRLQLRRRCLQPDGRIVVVGQRMDPLSLAVMRYLP